MPTTEVSFSNFLRDPKAVAEEATRGDVVLRRRNAPALLLSSAERESASFEGLRIVAQVLREIEADLKIREVVGAALLQAAPWAAFLPHSGLEAFTSEFLRTIEGAAQLTTFAPVAQLLHEWQETARAYAEGLDAELSRPLAGDGAPVARPRPSRKRR